MQAAMIMGHAYVTVCILNESYHINIDMCIYYPTCSTNSEWGNMTVFALIIIIMQYYL